MVSRFLPLAGNLLLMSSPIVAQPISPGPQARVLSATWDGSDQPYNLFVPSAHASGEALPLLVVLHGKGATWESWFAATNVCDWAEQEGLIVLAPHGRGDWFYRGPGEQDVLDAIAEVQRLCRVDPDRISLMGHSMGGWGAWYLGCTHPDRFATVIPMSGWAPLDLLPNARHLAPLIIHGDADEVVPPSGSREASRVLTELGIGHRLTIAPGVGHESSLISTVLPLAGEHLRTRRRVERPREITLRAASPARGRSHWLAIRDTGHFPNTAGIDASIDGDLIRIRTNSVRAFTIDPARAPLRDPSRFRVLVDHHEYDLSTGAGQVALFTRTHRSWMFAPMPRREDVPPPSPVVGRFNGPPEELVHAVVEVMRLRTDAEAGLMNADFIAPVLRDPEITADALLDLYLRPEDQLHSAQLSVGTIIESEEDWYPAWWGELIAEPPLDDLDPARVVTVVTVEPLAQRLPVQTTPLRITLRELLFNHLQQTGEIP
ncbi:MAG: dienelactone hydrolase family protein [Candidatus Sumerlaeia bacterium]|nr:dienelactone hydrolase family protein [Candidatus Sumerlaeia bacterium]